MFSELVWQAIQVICDQLSGDGVGGGGGVGQTNFIDWQTTDNFYDEEFQS